MGRPKKKKIQKVKGKRGRPRKIQKSTNQAKFVPGRSRGRPRKIQVSASAVEIRISSKSKAAAEKSISALLKRGKERGFVTYAEILYYFPTIEEDVLMLEDLYARLEQENIQILESKEFIDDGKAPATPAQRGRK